LVKLVKGLVKEVVKLVLVGLSLLLLRLPLKLSRLVVMVEAKMVRSLALLRSLLTTGGNGTE
jgi:hypothetical protein